jgi:hypothetical protein
MFTKDAFSLSAVRDLIRAQYPKRQDVVSVLEGCADGVWQTDHYLCLSEADRGEVHLKECILLWDPAPHLLLIVVDVLSDGRIRGLELIPPLQDPLEGYLKVDGHLVLHHTEYDGKGSPLWDFVLFLFDDESFYTESSSSLPKELLRECDAGLVNFACQIMTDHRPGALRDSALGTLKLRFFDMCRRLAGHRLTPLFSYSEYTASFRQSVGAYELLHRLNMRKGFLMYPEVQRALESLPLFVPLVFSETEHPLLYDFTKHRVHCIDQFEKNKGNLLDREQFERLLPNDIAGLEYVKHFGTSDVRYMKWSNKDADTVAMLQGSDLLFCFVVLRTHEDLIE